MRIISELLFMQMQMRIFHWQTNSYAKHEAFGGAYETLDGLIDNFIEVFQGKKGYIKAADSFNIELLNISDRNPIDFIEDRKKFLSNDLSSYLDKEQDTDLLNIRDEMLAVLNKTKYLLGLS